MKRSKTKPSVPYRGLAMTQGEKEGTGDAVVPGGYYRVAQTHQRAAEARTEARRMGEAWVTTAGHNAADIIREVCMASSALVSRGRPREVVWRKQRRGARQLRDLFASINR